MKYRNITVSGGVAVGTSTLARRLAEKLGWKQVNMGEWFRQYCREHNLALEETGQRSDELTRRVDGALRERLTRETHLVAEGWLTGFMAQGIPGILKVLVKAPLEVQVDRFAKREGVNAAEARRHISKRTEENFKKWQRVYREIDFFWEGLYDVVVDTGKLNKEAVVRKVTEALDAN